MVNNYKEKGLIEEVIFKLSLDNHSQLNCIKSCIDDDRFKHIDFYFDNGQSVDVKSSNRLINGEHHLWIELTNIYGNKGWLYGKATFIAFSLGDRYVFLKRKDLKKHIYIKGVNSKKYKIKGGYKDTEPYIVYTRRGCKDKIVLVPLQDLLRFSHFFIKRDISLLSK